MAKPTRPRFPGLTLTEADREWLRERKKQKLGMLESRRIEILRLLDEGWTLTATAEATGTYRREIRRVGWRYLEGGVEHALADEPRRKVEPMLDSVQTAALVAMVCGPPPEGRARWTLSLIVDEAKRRRLVTTISRQTVHRILKRQDIKPWREKNVVRSGDH